MSPMETTTQTRAPMRIRLAQTEADIDALLALCRLAHAESRYAKLPFGMVRMRAVGLKMLRAPETNGLLMIERGGEAVGCLIASATRLLFADAIAASAMLFYVKPEARASRAAVALLMGFSQWAKARGAVEATIHVTSGLRQEEVSYFLKRKGFIASGENFYLEL